MRTALLLPVLLAACASAAAHAPQSPLVSIDAVDPTIIVEARYFGDDNFVGRRITGYEAPKCLLTPEAARALAAVQAEVRQFGLSLKTYDCYRPQRAVNDFVAWARDPADTLMKQEFYPALDKSRLFPEGYIAERSGHSRGSTVDLTLVPLTGRTADVPSSARRAPTDGGARCTGSATQRAPDTSLDMGTGYDCFDPLAHTANPAVGADAARNRLLLKAVMEKHGFRNYAQEWWHFTLRDEPFPDTYFDEPVR